jgi:hypothetical protein
MLKSIAFVSYVTFGVVVAAANSSAHDMQSNKSDGGFAVVNADGSLGGNKNLTSISHPSAGVYDLQFKKNVDFCAINGTIGGTTQTLLPGYIVVQRAQNLVTVNTFATLTLTPTDYKFDVNVTCSK